MHTVLIVACVVAYLLVGFATGLVASVLEVRGAARTSDKPVKADTIYGWLAGCTFFWPVVWAAMVVMWAAEKGHGAAHALARVDSMPEVQERRSRELVARHEASEARERDQARWHAAHCESCGVHIGSGEVKFPGTQASRETEGRWLCRMCAPDRLLTPGELPDRVSDADRGY